MTSGRTKNLMGLIGSVCDERFEKDDLQQLNQLLMTDPIAQEEYLDQMLIDGLLQREFAGLHPAEWQSEPEREQDREQERVDGHRRGRIAIQLVLAVLVLAGASGVWSLRADATPEVNVVLTNASFEDVASVSYHPTHSGWYGGTAHIVQGVAGVSPQHGEHMLQLIRSTSKRDDSCEVYQIVDLRHVADQARNQPMFIEATALVNSLVGDHSDSWVFSIHLYASSIHPLDQQSPLPTNWKSSVASVGNQVTADLDHRTWQQLSSVMPLNADARFLLIRISVRGGDNQWGDVFPGHFVDNVTLELKRFSALKNRMKS